MKIKEKDEQHMIIEPTTGERLLGVLSLVLLIISIYVFLSVSPGLSFFVIIAIVWIFICLYFAGKMLGRRIVFNRPTDSVILEARHFMLIHKKRVVPLSAVTGVSTVLKSKTDWWKTLSNSLPSDPKEYLEVSIFIGDKKIKIAHSSDGRSMVDLSSQMSAFIGNNTDR